MELEVIVEPARSELAEVGDVHGGTVTIKPDANGPL